MHIVPKIQNKLYVHSCTGSIFGPYQSLEDMVTYLDTFTARSFGLSFEKPFENKFFFFETQFIAKDSYNNVIDPKDVLKAYTEYRKKIREDKTTFKFRNGPVPKTGKQKNNDLIKINHRISEQKQLEAHQEYEKEYSIKIRAKRKNLKPNFDYKFIFKEKNWKKFRKNQWKAL